MKYPGQHSSGTCHFRIRDQRGLWFLAIAFLIGIMTFDAMAKEKRSLKVAPPISAPEWADTNHDGQLSKSELQQAIKILKSKLSQTRKR